MAKTSTKKVSKGSEPYSSSDYIQQKVADEMDGLYRVLHTRSVDKKTTPSKAGKVLITYDKNRASAEIADIPWLKDFPVPIIGDSFILGSKSYRVINRCFIINDPAIIILTVLDEK